MDPRLGVFFINLDRAPDRRTFMDSQMATAGLTATRVPAVDAKAADFVPRGGLAVTRDDVFIETNWDGRVYVRGEEACFQSHIKALKTFLESPAEIGLIFEDDAELAPDFGATVDAILGYRQLWDLVKLEGTRNKGGRPAFKVAKVGDYELVASLNPCSGAAAYLVTRAAAQTLVAQSEGVFEPFDNYLSAHWRHGLKALDCSPFPARQGLPVSTRQETRGPVQRSMGEKFTAWQRHLRADFVGRYVLRWLSQPKRFKGKGGGWTVAPWGGNW
ncbi:hypothetical protein sos41_36200 [Alphaproteobacteria bacterium SO-S41]|nr:hypothetical protein sos41_36200 [Alphaproteobacteria bacterium SO-S41]